LAPLSILYDIARCRPSTIRSTFRDPALLTYPVQYQLLVQTLQAGEMETTQTRPGHAPLPQAMDVNGHVGQPTFCGAATGRCRGEGERTPVIFFAGGHHGGARCSGGGAAGAWSPRAERRHQQRQHRNSNDNDYEVGQAMMHACRPLMIATCPSGKWPKI